MNLNTDEKRRTGHFDKPEPLVIQKKSAFQSKLILLVVALVTVIWVGVTIYLVVELIRRVYG